MSASLTWADLFLQDPSLDFARVFSCWPQFAFDRVRPIGLSAFGDCYFERNDGSIHVLDPLEGQVRQVAASNEEFSQKMNSPQWQEANLMPAFLAQVLARGLPRNPNQVFGFAPHPAFSGKLSAEHAMPLDAVVWHSISSQMFSSVPPKS